MKRAYVVIGIAAVALMGGGCQESTPGDTKQGSEHAASADSTPATAVSPTNISPQPAATNR